MQELAKEVRLGTGLGVSIRSQKEGVKWVSCGDSTRVSGYIRHLGLYKHSLGHCPVPRPMAICPGPLLPTGGA